MFFFRGQQLLTFLDIIKALLVTAVKMKLGNNVLQK